MECSTKPGCSQAWRGSDQGPFRGEDRGVCPEEVSLDFTALTKRDHPRAEVVS